jgi:hypothetical protein
VDTTQSSGISAAFVLGLVFLILKLCHVIDWSWWLVLLPWYAGAGLALIIAVIVGIVALGVGAVKSNWDNR